jgi:hypothetical protein
MSGQGTGPFSVSYDKAGRPIQPTPISVSLQQCIRAELKEMASVLEPKIANDSF